MQLVCGRFGVAGWLMVVMLPGEATADSAHRSGEQVYEAVCMRCHGPSDIQAPKLGDRKDWTPLIEEGQHIITARMGGLACETCPRARGATS